MSRLLDLLLLLYYLGNIVLCSDEYFCNYPLVTDLAPEDCDKSNNLYYREDGGINGCFPGCVEASPRKSCGVLQCAFGYFCSGTECQPNDESCYRYHVDESNDKYVEARWKPECLPDESWAPKQCKGEAANGRCFCFDGKGNRIFGEAPSLDAEDMTCACSRHRAEMEEGEKYIFVSLHCDSMGNYDPLQCDVLSEQCWCVEPKTGDLTSLVVPASLMTRLPCYNETTVGSQYLRQCESQLYAQKKVADEFEAHGTQRLNFPTVLCQYDGSYGPYKMLNGIGYCVSADGSNLGSYSSEFKDPTERMNCNCARDERAATQAGLHFLVACAINGNYKPLQKDGDEYFCVDDDGFIKSDHDNEELNCALFV